MRLETPMAHRLIKTELSLATYACNERAWRLGMYDPNHRIADIGIPQQGRHIALLFPRHPISIKPVMLAPIRRAAKPAAARATNIINVIKY